MPAGDGKQLVYVNMPRAIHYDPLDPADRTRADLMLREQLLSVHRFLTDHIPGFARIVHYFHQPLGGDPRKSAHRRRVCARCQGNPGWKELRGCHLPVRNRICRQRPSASVDGEEGAEGSTYEFPEKKWHEYEVPYGAMVPKKIDHLLVAGRCYSATHGGLGLAKSVPVMMALGQAAGCAAALSIASGVTPRALDVNELQRRLIADGVYLPDVR